MSDEQVLTKEIAEQFVADEDSVGLWEFTAIEDDAAESLIKHEGFLNLNGLTSLSDAAAESLSKCEGYLLYLGGLTELSDVAAESLSKYEGFLNLNGLTSLSDAAAESLSKHKAGQFLRGSHLWLNGLTSLSDKVAESLSKYEGDLHLSVPTSLMTLRIACPFCKTQYNLAVEMLGKDVQCKNCAGAFTVWSKDFCECCGIRAPTRKVAFHQNIGQLVERTHKVFEGYACKPCIRSIFLKFTCTTFFLGWWGLISFLVTPCFIINNIVHYLLSLRMPAVASDHGSISTGDSDVSVGMPLQTRHHSKDGQAQ